MTPKSPTRLTHVQMLKGAFASARIKEYYERLMKVAKEGFKKRESEFELELSGAKISYDFTIDSLQSRVVAYMKENVGLRDLQKQLVQAERTRKVTFRRVNEEALLGIHPGNIKELTKFVEGFSDYELSLLNTVIVSENRSQKLQSPALIDLVSRKLREGRGEALIQYLGARIDLQRKRERRSGAPPEIFNRTLFLLGCMWTDPDRPLWLMPSAGAIRVIHQIGDGSGRNVMNPSAYNSLVRENGLHRLKQSILDKFITKIVSDPAGVDLCKQFEAAMGGVTLSSVRRGRKPSAASRRGN